jgi:prepilin-type N-terminal cleavage/methylation domain-containing protein
VGGKEAALARRAAGERGFTLVEILVVMAIMAALMAMVASAVVRAPTAKNKLVCTNNLRQLGALMASAAIDGKVKRHTGAGYLVQFRAKGQVLEGDEAVFLCPQDDAFAASGRPGFSARYASLDLDRVPSDLCSYLVRDWKRSPVAADSPRKEPVAACPHHREGVTVLYQDGSVRFLDREVLGIDPKDPIVFGPGSPSEDLRVFPGAK